LAFFALANNTTGSSNEAIGVDALASGVDGSFNVAIGDHALGANVHGTGNTAVGNTAGGTLTGFANTLIGAGARSLLTTGSNNICIGFAVQGHAGEDSFIRIADNLAQVGGTTSTVFFGGINGATVGAGNTPVVINANGQLGTAPSSARFKKDIESMGKTSEVIYSLRPVTFRYKGDETNTPCSGLIAEEVAKVDPTLILLDKEGKPQTVRYEQVNAMLLNEFLKEHRKVQEEETTIAQLKSGMDTLVAHIKDQDAKIQKVTDQLAIDKVVPQVATLK
jgi:hypothetical protein